MVAPSFSFEFFPPKTEEGIASFMHAARDLAALKPTFLTVTFPADGQKRELTADLALKIQNETGLACAAHLTFINLSKSELQAYTDKLWEKGVRRVIALRGDFPTGWQAPDYSKGEHYRYTDEFVRGLRTQHDFDISVGAYPEKHPDAPDLASDIDALRKKCSAGATRAITQFFFDNATYFRFVDMAAKAGVKTPIVPGLLPIQNFARAQTFAARCGASIPAWLASRFENLTEVDAEKAATDIMVEQVRGLIDQGVPHFHFYALNKSPLCIKVARAAGLVE